MIMSIFVRKYDTTATTKAAAVLVSHCLNRAANKDPLYSTGNLKKSPRSWPIRLDHRKRAILAGSTKPLRSRNRLAGSLRRAQDR